MRVFLIGAAGGIGRRLSPRLVTRGFEVSGMHRKREQAADVENSGANPVACDLITDSVDDLAARMAGHDAVVFSAGAHGTGIEQTNLIDGEGLKKSVRAATQAGVRRFVLVSVFPEAGRTAGLGDSFENYIRIKKAADVYLSHSDLDWLIVRPGTLVDDEGDGRVAAGPAVPYGQVSRDNVAAFIDAVLAAPEVRRTIVELTDGSVPVAEAVDHLVG